MFSGGEESLVVFSTGCDQTGHFYIQLQHLYWCRKRKEEGEVLFLNKFR